MMEDADLEDAPDGDGLAAALFATRAESQLPPALLARGTRPKKHAGLPTLGEVESVVDGDEGAGVEWGAARGKRKERGFTVSGTGTGSSSGSGSSVSDRADSRGLAMPSGGGPDGEREGLRTEFGLGNPRIEDAHQTNGANGLSEEHLRERERIRANVPQPNGPCLANWSSPCRYLAAQCQVSLVAVIHSGDNAYRLVTRRAILFSVWADPINRCVAGPLGQVLCGARSDWRGSLQMADQWCVDVI